MSPFDSLGNRIDPELSYATGEILETGQDQYDEALAARRIIENRWQSAGPESIYNFSGLERGFPVEADDIGALDDETAPALYEDQLTELTLEHLGGRADEHDAFLANRTTAATTSSFLTLVDAGETVIGVAPNHSHASVVRAADVAGAEFVDTNSYEEFRRAFDSAESIGLVALSRMDVTYEILDADTVQRVIETAHDHGTLVYMDDAGGARVAPALFDRPRSLELGVDVVSTGLDKYGVYGPRFGVMGGRSDLVSRIRSQAWKLGLEARPTAMVAAVRSLQRYDPQRVRELHETTMELGSELRRREGIHIERTDSIIKLTGEEILRTAMDRTGITETSLVPIEATGALSMILLRDHGIITVHFVGIPSGTPDLLLKFLPPEEIERFGGVDEFADAIDSSITELSRIVDDTEAIRSLLLEA